MKICVDAGSAALGLVLGVIATLSIGAATAPVSPIGRYQVVLSSNNSPYVAGAVIDTTTGQVWLQTALYGGGVNQKLWVAPKNVSPEVEDSK